MSNAIDYLVSSCGNFMWEIKTTDFVAKSDTGYFIDTSSGSVSATLPSTASIGDQIYFVDSTGSFSDADKVVILNNGHNIMGKFDVMEITEKYMSIYLVYADTTKGWVIADGKGCDEDPNGGEITVDTTIFLAPSASAYSPTGKVGSDTTGDGSIDAPFYSIKRAIKYLENYRIKVGAYVTIQGLPGKYQYNDNHVVEIKHKDAKYIKVKFDSFSTGYYHSTTIDFNTAVSQDTSNYDSAAGTGYVLVTFTVNDMGTGFYQIQAGDYIKLVCHDYDNNNTFERACWGGYHRVTAVDVGNKTVTIIVKYYGYYNTSFPNQIIPDTLATSDVVNVYKLSSHVNISINDTSKLNHESFIYSEFGFGGIQINASDEGHYSPIDNTTFVYHLINIYDGVLNDIVINANGFYYGVKLTNLLAYFDESDTDRIFCSFTSCNTGILFTQSETEISKITINNGIGGIVCNQSKLLFVDGILKSFMNLKGAGLSGIGSTFKCSMDYDYNKKILFGYCADGAYISGSSVLYIVGCYIKRCFYGVGLLSSVFRSFLSTGNDLTGKPRQIIEDCSTGIYASNSSSIHLRNCEIKDCNSGCDIETTSFTSDVFSSTIDNCDKGISATLSNCSVEDLTVSDCSVWGIYFNESTAYINDVTVDNSAVNVYAYYGAYLRIRNSSFTNGTYGLYVISSRANIQNDSSNNISGNSSYNIRCRYGSQCNVNTDNNITNTSPAVNTAPTTSGFDSDNYIGMTVY